MTALAERPTEVEAAPARIQLHDNCRVCHVVNDPLPHDPEPRGMPQASYAVPRGVPAEVARYCRMTGQDVPDWSEA